MEQTGLRRFRRVADGVVGFGFITTDIGRPLACIAFPIGEPKKLEYQDLAGYGVEDLGEASGKSDAELNLQAEVEANVIEFEKLNLELSESKDLAFRALSELTEAQKEISSLKAEIESLKKGGKPDASQTEPDANQTPDGESDLVDEAASIEAYLKEHGTSVTNKSVIEALKAQGVVVQSAQVTAAKEKLNTDLAE